MKRPWIPVLIFAAAWTLLTAAAAAWGQPWRAESSIVPNSLLLFGLILGLGLAPPLRAFIRDLPGVYRGIAIAVLGLIFAGHLFGHSRNTFPFVRWDMFTWVYEPEVVVFHDYYGIDAAGEKRKLNVARLFRSLHSTVYWHLEEWGEGTRTDPDLIKWYGPLLRSIGDRYNALHPDDKIVALAVERGTIVVDDDRELQVERTSPWAVRLPSGMSP